MRSRTVRRRFDSLRRSVVAQNPPRPSTSSHRTWTATTSETRPRQRLARESQVAPDLEFLGQPYDEDATAGAFVRRVLRDEAYGHFTAVVAWARFRGIRRIS